MPTFVSPATSTLSGPPTWSPGLKRGGHVAPRAIESSQFKGRGVNGPATNERRRGRVSGRRAQGDGDLAEFVVGSEDEELHFVADRVLGDDVGELVGGVDG